MRIYSFSKILGLPLAVLIVTIAYFSYEMEGNISAWIFLPVLLMVAVYVFHGPIDHWWLTQYPIPFDPRLRDWLNRYFIYYSQLNESDKEVFEYRMTLYLDARLFKSIGSEQRDVPEDLKCMVAAHGIYMCLYQKDYLIGDMDRIFLYKHPFPSPRHPYLHNVETDTEDGVIVLSLEQLTQSILHPKKFFNTAFYAYAESFIATQKNKNFPNVQEDSWSEISSISGLSKENTLQQIGLKEANLLAIHITIYFVFHEEYEQNFPYNYKAFKDIFLNSSMGFIT